MASDDTLPGPPPPPNNPSPATSTSSDPQRRNPRANAGGGGGGHASAHHQGSSLIPEGHHYAPPAPQYYGYPCHFPGPPQPYHPGLPVPYCPPPPPPPPPSSYIVLRRNARFCSFSFLGRFTFLVLVIILSVGVMEWLIERYGTRPVLPSIALDSATLAPSEFNSSRAFSDFNLTFTVTSRIEGGVVYRDVRAAVALGSDGAVVAGWTRQASFVRDEGTAEVVRQARAFRWENRTLGPPVVGKMAEERQRNSGVVELKAMIDFRMQYENLKVWRVRATCRGLNAAVVNGTTVGGELLRSRSDCKLKYFGKKIRL